MYLTEAEARTQECPHFRDVINQAEVANYNVAPIYAHRICCASACKMAWRWRRRHFLDFGAKTLDEMTEEQRIGIELYNSTKVGYCGISGKPEED